MNQLKTKKLVQMKHICKDFSGVQVLDNVNFDLYAGEVHVLAGENGAGKSTLIKILSGVHSDYEGSVFIDEQKVHFKSVNEGQNAGIAVIHQELSVVGTMTVAENIFLGRERRKKGILDKKRMRQEAVKFLENVGLSNINVNKAAGDYSVGIQQLIEICKALAFKSKIIVMDEPTSALTDPEVEMLFGIIEKLKENGCGIIYISHKMDEIFEIADRITVLRDGEYIGTSDAGDLDNDKLVNWMVGRELNQQFPRHQPKNGGIIFKVNNFTLPDPSGKPNPLVQNISFELKEGEILGFAGLQGSGNSELFNALFGSYGKIAKGNVFVDNKSYKPYHPGTGIKEGLALLTNDRKGNGLVMDMSIQYNSTLASLKKYSPGGWLKPKKEQKVVSELSSSLNLKCSGLRQEVKYLSGGNQQKVVIAKWMDTDPKVMLLDEPTRGVDVGAKHEIYELMNKWTSEGIGILLITSEMPELLAMSDRILVMHRGRITAEFSSEEATQEEILKAAMGESQEN